MFKFVLLVGTFAGVETFEGDALETLLTTANNKLTAGLAPNGVLLAERLPDLDYIVKFKWPGPHGYGLSIQDLP